MARRDLTVTHQNVVEVMTGWFPTRTRDELDSIIEDVRRMLDDEQAPTTKLGSVLARLQEEHDAAITQQFAAYRARWGNDN